jgi:hypothetical protein
VVVVDEVAGTVAKVAKLADALVGCEVGTAWIEAVGDVNDRALRSAKAPPGGFGAVVDCDEMSSNAAEVEVEDLDLMPGVMIVGRDTVLTVVEGEGDADEEGDAKNSLETCGRVERTAAAGSCCGACCEGYDTEAAGFEG